MRRVLEELELVRHKDHNLVFQSFSHALEVDLVCDLGVNCAQWIIQKHDLCIRVDSSSQTNSCLLPTRDVDSSFTNDSLNTISEDLDISREL